MNGLMHGAFREAAHQSRLFYFVEIFFEMAFHVRRPFSPKKVHQYEWRKARTQLIRNGR